MKGTDTHRLGGLPAQADRIGSNKRLIHEIALRGYTKVLD